MSRARTIYLSHFPLRLMPAARLSGECTHAHLPLLSVQRSLLIKHLTLPYQKKENLTLFHRGRRQPYPALRHCVDRGGRMVKTAGNSEIMEHVSFICEKVEQTISI